MAAKARLVEKTAVKPVPLGAERVRWMALAVVTRSSSTMSIAGVLGVGCGLATLLSRAPYVTAAACGQLA